MLPQQIENLVLPRYLVSAGLGFLIFVFKFWNLVEFYNSYGLNWKPRINEWLTKVCDELLGQLKTVQEGYCNFISCISVNFQNVQMSPQIACLRMQSLIGCICLTILHCAFTDAPSASSEHLNQRKYIYIGCICFSFLPCAFSNVSSNGPP